MNPTRSRHGEARCAELIGIARDLLVEGGLDTFAMRTVAARAGMRLGNLQYYYATRDDLLEEVIRTEFERDLNTVRDTVTADPAENHELAQLAHRLVHDWCAASGVAFLTLASLAYRSERFGALNREIYERFYAEMSSIILRLDSKLDPGEVAIRARLMTSVLDGVALQVHAVPGDAASRSDLIDQAGQLIVAVATGSNARDKVRRNRPLRLP